MKKVMIVLLAAVLLAMYGCGDVTDGEGKNPEGDPGLAATMGLEEKTEFNVILKEVGTHKKDVIELLEVFIGCGLKEAKELVDSAPTVIKEKVPKKEANKIKEKLEKAGATVELK